MKAIACGLLALLLIGCGGAVSDKIESADSAFDTGEGDGTDAGPPVSDDAAPEAARDATVDASNDARLDVSVRDAADARVDATADVACLPTSRQVACANARCGTVSDGCSGTYTCAACTAPMVCVANSCQCPNQTDAAYCAGHGYGCGTVTDSCSGVARNCGTCTASLTCGGGGRANVCGCTPLASCPAGDNCGTAPDGCGGTVNCGACTGTNTCGGAGVANHCGCTPLASCPAGDDCGAFPDGCGGPPLNCGTCVAPQTCGGAGTPNQCGCTSAMCPASGCGFMPDGCGNTLDCGACAAWQVCGSSLDGGPPDSGSNTCATPNACCDLCPMTTDATCAGIAVLCNPSLTLAGGCVQAGATDGGSVEWCCP